ncbi:hypothetical protein [Pseudomonas aeruginosa]|uniref:hypothetical protein n=1 Tax=Pseudomonas aeruginosa TaxID=287 RepID=UPI0028119CED|nr:hypothetical protein [Pseudomonas aeruginosa]
MATVTHVLSGAGEPLDPPPSIGAHYVNTNNGALYMAKGTASGADWVKLGSGGGSAPSEVLHVNTDGQFLLEPQHSFVNTHLLRPVCSQFPSSALQQLESIPAHPDSST